MASSSCSVLISVAIVLQFLLLVPGSASFIDAICKNVADKAFCLNTLKAYPPAASATDKYQAADAALRLGMSNAKTNANFAEKAANENPNLKQQFNACQDEYKNIIASLKSAARELKESPVTANYDVMVCYDHTTMVKNLIGKYTDKDAKALMSMTLMMDKFIAIGVGATVSVGG